MSAKILVLYYSSYGHVEAMADAVAEGARAVGAEVHVKRVPELVPDEVAQAAGYQRDPAVPIATVDELPGYDAILFGTPTRYGAMAAQMKNFIDQTGGLWSENRLVGKAAGVFVSTGSQHGGQESTILGFHTVLLHLGMVVVGLPYSFAGLNRMDEVAGGSPYGASTLSGSDDARRPSALELDGARFQGQHVATIAGKLAA